MELLSQGSRRLALLGLSSVVAAASAGAQATQFRELALKRHLPPLAPYIQSVATGDFDGDGRADVVVGHYNAATTLLLANGDGTFRDESARLPAPADDTRVVVAADVDADGDLDLIEGQSLSVGASTRLYLNDGSGYFTDVTATNMPALALRTQDVQVGDVDGDTDLDVMVAVSYEKARLFLNDGTGLFTDVSATNMPGNLKAVWALDLADVDDDGDLDAFLARTERDNLYLNDGNGVFSIASGSQWPNESWQPTDIEFADLNGDAHVDLVVGHYNQITRVYLNDGVGNLVDFSATSLPTGTDRALAVSTGDVDGDGDLDLLLARGNLTFVKLLLNDGAAVFSEAVVTSIGASTYTDVAVLRDLDDDGDLDVFAAGGDGRIHLNGGVDAGTPTFADASPSRGWGTRSTGFAAGDVDGDGDEDVVATLGVYFTLGDPNVLYRNEGLGVFTSETIGGYLNSEDVALGDVDGDGDLDAVFANVSLGFIGYGATPTPNTLHRNDGAGAFTWDTAALPADADESYAIELADFDGDGDLDIVTGNLNQQNRYYRNDGTGTYSDVTGTHMPAATNATRAMAVGDVDGDGDVDLVVANEGQQNRLYINEQGHFFDLTGAQMPADAQSSRAVELADLDGDGDLDLVFANTDVPSLYLNDGFGTFVDNSDRFPIQTGSSFALALGDVDDDGDLDVFLGNHGSLGGPGADTLYLNKGNAFFQLASVRLPGDLDMTTAAILVDVDDDRDADLLTTERFYLNLHRQLEAPLVPVLGRTYELDVYAQPGYATADRLAVLAFGFGIDYAGMPAPAPIQGTLFLQAPFVTLPPVVVPAATGYVRVSLPVPLDLGLSGITFGGQAAILGGGPQLTGLKVDTFVR